MGRYETRGDFQNELWGRLSNSGQGVLGMMLKEKLQKKQQEAELQNALKKIELISALKEKSRVANPSFLDQKRRDFMLESGAVSPTEEELAPFAGQSQAMATKLGAQRAMPAEGGFVLPTPGQNNEFLEGATQPTQDISSQIPGIQPQDLFRGQVAKRMSAYKAMAGKGTVTPEGTFKGQSIIKTIENTKKVADNISTKEDLQELISNRDAYEAEGVNVDKILNMYSDLLK